MGKRKQKQKEEDQLPVNIIDGYGQFCELGDGRKCFGPGEALQKFVSDCKEGKLVMANGEVWRAEPDEIPLVINIKEQIHDQLINIAGSKGMTVQDFLLAYIALLMDDDDVVKELTSDLEKIAEDSPIFGVPDMWGDSEDPPPTNDTAPIDTIYGEVSEHDNAMVSNKKRIARINVAAIKKLEGVLNRIHDSKGGDIKIWMGFHNPDEIQLNIDYPEDGIRLRTLEEGGLVAAFVKHVSRLDKWEKLTFGPKLESGTEVKASIGAKILEFDKSIGKYKVEIAPGVVVDIDADQIGAILGEPEVEESDE